MPRKKKLLPQPCPICKRQNGTIRIQVYPQGRSDIVCKIGHYIAEEYKNPHRIKIDQDPEGPNNFPPITRASKNRGKVWHRFRIDDSLARRNSFELYKILNYFLEITRYEKRSRDFKPQSNFEEIIKTTGWCMKPYSRYYHGRKRKYSEYHFPKEEYYNLYQDDKLTTPD